MSFTLTIQCPKHPTYMAKIRPSASCRECQLMFVFRNNVHKVLSVPREERTDADEKIIAAIA